MSTRILSICAFFLISVLTLSAQSGTTSSGAKYTTLTPGSGPSPRVGQEVLFNASMLAADGTTTFSTREALGYTMHGKIGQEQDAFSKAIDEVWVLMQKGGTVRIELPKTLLPDNDPNKKTPGDYQIYLVELVDVLDARPSGTDLVVATANKEGVAAAEAQFQKLQQNSPAAYTFYEGDMNAAGYKALKEKKFDIALAIFKMNTVLYPNSSNVFDSLGDAYLAKEDKANAKINFQKAVDLNPKAKASQEKLDKL